ncbi:carboxymuconolactone decarboxylase family protein [Chloroflexota bacterium]
MDAKGKAILERVKRERDFITKSREVMAEWDPDILENYHEMFMHVKNKRKGLSPKMMEVLFVSVDAATMYEKGIAPHIRSAIKAGATPYEIFDGLLAAYLASGIHALTMSLPIFADTLKELGITKE